MSDLAFADSKAIIESYIHANRDPLTVALTTFLEAANEFNLRALVTAFAIFNALSTFNLVVFQFPDPRQVVTVTENGRNSFYEALGRLPRLTCVAEYTKQRNPGRVISFTLSCRVGVED
ncbi:hypothetical protein FPQ18DRAFT_307301 [Pyronema domesticum]|nr:hypothetical protein FPQ18DRAFT_307301 [Pyronema domesticum]